MREKEKRKAEERNSAVVGEEKRKGKIRNDVIIDVHGLEFLCKRLTLILGQMGKYCKNNIEILVLFHQ